MGLKLLILAIKLSIFKQELLQGNIYIFIYLNFIQQKSTNADLMP